MKRFYFKTILAFCFLLSNFTQAQTYNINTAADPTFGYTCPGNPGIDATYNCAIDGQPAIDLGSFTDTNTSGVEISTMDLTIYGACSGDVEFFINGTSVTTGNATGLSCSCQSISSDPNIPQNYTVTITPTIIAAYNIGGVNTLSVSSSNSAASAQCFYGADVTVTTTTLGVNDFKFYSIKIYPNPASDFITISGLKNRENFRVYDILGTEIIKGKIIDNGQIAIGNFSNGIYFLKFDNRNTIKFIKE